MNDALLMLVRAVMYGGVLAAFGVPAYCACAPVAVRQALGAEATVWRIVAASAALGLAATVLYVLCLTAAMNGVELAAIDRDMIGFTAQEMPVGRAALVRFAALVALLAIGTVARGRARITAGIVLAGLATLTLPWNGHAVMHEGAQGWVHLAADAVHLLAAGLWLGGLVGLVHIATSRAMDTSVRQSAFAGFSRLGSLIVAALLLTGVINSLMILGLPTRGWLGSTYVAVLAAKLVLFAVALSFAAGNRFRLVPVLATGSDPALATRRLATSVSIELAVLLAIVAVVGVLGVLSPE